MSSSCPMPKKRKKKKKSIRILDFVTGTMGHNTTCRRQFGVLFCFFSSPTWYRKHAVYVHLLGHRGHTVIPHSSLLDPSHCTQEAEWSIGFPGAVCDASVSFHRLAFNKPSPISLLEKDVVLSDSFGKWNIVVQATNLSMFSIFIIIFLSCHCLGHRKGVIFISVSNQAESK